jgi:1-acyl-sn-glycerol-3-phosphate acyltransferase
MANSGSFSALTEINIDDLLNAWGLGDVRLGRGLLRALARPPSAAFAREVIRLDETVGQSGLRAGGAWFCQRHSGGVRAAGLEHVPRQGAALFLANHPGLCDTVALFATVPRDDLRVIAADRPFLRALPHTARHLDLLPEAEKADAGLESVDIGRAGIARAVARYLRGGGAALTFPAGQIEPDPLVLPGAGASLDTWSASVGLFTRLVPQMQIVVVMVGGVYTPAVLDHPLTRLRRQREDRELLAAALQLAWRRYQHNVIDVVFAPPLRAADLLARDSDPARITEVITDRARQVLAYWPTQWCTVVPGQRS